MYNVRRVPLEVFAAIMCPRVLAHITLAPTTSAIDNTSATWLTQLIINWALFTFALPFLLAAILGYVKDVEASVCERGKTIFARIDPDI